MFKSLKKLLRKTTKKEDGDFLEYLEIKKRWTKTINQKIKKNTEITDFTNGVLTIKAKNGVWKNELVFMQDNLKKNFQPKQQ